MAHGTTCSTKLINFGKSCSGLTSLKCKNKGEFVTAINNFGNGLKYAMQGEIAVKLLVDSDSRVSRYLDLKIPIPRIDNVLDAIACSTNSEECLKAFDDARTKFEQDTKDYLDNVRQKYNDVMKDLNSNQLAMKGHFQTFYNSVMQEVPTLTSFKEQDKTSEITICLGNLESACSTYIKNSKKAKKILFVAVSKGRAACIANIWKGVKGLKKCASKFK